MRRDGRRARREAEGAMATSGWEEGGESVAKTDSQSQALNLSASNLTYQHVLFLLAPICLPSFHSQSPQTHPSPPPSLVPPPANHAPNILPAFLAAFPPPSHLPPSGRSLMTMHWAPPWAMPGSRTSSTGRPDEWRMEARRAISEENSSAVPEWMRKGVLDAKVRFRWVYRAGRANHVVG